MAQASPSRTPVSPDRCLKRARSSRSPPTTPTPVFRSFSSGSVARRRNRYRLASPGPESDPVSQLSDSEFQFSTPSCSDASDSESLPELVEDSSTPSTLQSPATPFRPKVSYFDNFESPLKRLSSAPALTPRFVDPPFSQPFSPPAQPAFSSQQVSQPVSQPSIFDIPELVHKIIVYADAQNTVVPREKTPVCRKPLSYRHALLVHGNEKAAHLAMQGAYLDEPTPENTSNVLHTCLLVNKLFHRVAKEVLGEKLFFTDERTFGKFIDPAKPQHFYDGMSPKTLVLSKMFYLRQAHFASVCEKLDLSRLEWLELYMCPKVAPTVSFLQPSLKTLIVTGSKALDDFALVEVAQRCPNLQVLDVRACENVTDHGIYSIGQKCKNLTTLNLGRKKRGHLITDHSVCAVAVNNPRLTTVGVAGCYITDRSIWQLTLTCGKRLQRLSLNNCPYVSDQSVPVVLHHNLLQNLTVLEIRFVSRITNFEPIIAYKRRQAARGVNVLVETCEELFVRMRDQAKNMDRVISERVVRDISEWANGKDDDMAAADLLRTRSVGSRIIA
ncbi:hypothetical protein CA3LBN_002810 [Candidozyma haemuli]|uniref:F-box/LRR-repeat protein 15-like leucin rich repeat domain-containing protein n=1 Tax=Candidozyma haemuli TaxID=45357 RepID=A0ABX8I5V2_9ASCO|nr:hypothetical protein CA3LBN_002810 [[Candida] haemuloni]